MTTTKLTNALLAAGLGLLLAGCATTPAPAPVPEPVASSAPVATDEELPTPPAYVDPFTFAAVGDSITAPVDLAVNPAGVPTWVNFAPSDELAYDASGWSMGGSKIGTMAENVGPTTADVLVVMAGTNDMGTARWATPLGERSESLVTIVVKSGAPRVLVLAVAPLNGGAEWVNEWNAELARLSAFYGWNFFDPWAGVRDANGDYVAGLTYDGIHPTAEAAEVVGTHVREEVLSLLG